MPPSPIGVLCLATSASGLLLSPGAVAVTVSSQNEIVDMQIEVGDDLNY